MKALRLAAICSSLGLLFGCVWFTQKQANRTTMPSSKSIDQLLSLPANQTSRAGMMPGSKSFTGPTINAQSLPISPAPQPTKP